MQVGGTMQGASNIPRRGRRLEVLLAIAAIVVIAVVVALQVWVVPPATTSGVGAEAASPKAGAGSAIIHDDAGNMP